MPQADPHPAAPESVPCRPLDDVRTLGDCWRSFAKRPSPPILAAGILLGATLRASAGTLGWRDAVVAGGVVALTPFAEWAIHFYLLHARPLRIGRVVVDLPTAREHRAHHAAPAVLDGVLLPPYGVLIFLPMMAATVWVLSFPIQLVLGGNRLAGAATGLLVSYLILSAYEWTHFLIHTRYLPRGRYYRSIWRNHRLHHYRNERYWFGVTSTLGDQAIGTNPDQREVRRSRTARSLHPNPR